MVFAGQPVGGERHTGAADARAAGGQGGSAAEDHGAARACLWLQRYRLQVRQLPESQDALPARGQLQAQGRGGGMCPLQVRFLGPFFSTAISPRVVGQMTVERIWTFDQIPILTAP
jgi:hypothetical protein